jgi:hypothetical protein
LLRQVIEHAYTDGNAALRELAEERAPALRCAAQADFHYVMPDGARAIPAAQFHRQYELCLQALEVTIYGYRVQAQFGWERRLESVFSLRRPALWRRVLRPAPLLAFKVTAQQGQGAASISIVTAQRPGYINKSNYIVRLGPELQQQLNQVHSAQIAAKSLSLRFKSWFSRFKK